MSDVVIRVEEVSKMYRLGMLSSGSLASDLNRFYARLRRKEDPNEKVGIRNDLMSSSEYIWSLKDISFDIKQGDALGIIGKNGAGKSTLLKILSRVTAPTSGTIKIKGRVSSLLEVGTGFHPELSGRDNIFMNGAILGMSRTEIKSRFDEIVGFSGADKFIDTPVKRYSSGMYVRLAFAVAAHLEPDILIVDEVLAVGDAEFQKKCLGKMQDVNNKEGRTVLFVSHNMPSIQTLCTSAIVLENGLLKLQGSVKSAFDFYVSNKKNQMETPLSERKDRSGSGEIRIKDISLKAGNNTQIDKAITGEDLIICIEYISLYSIQNDFLLRIQFVDLDENILFICNNEHAKQLFSSALGTKKAECKIPKLPLFAGEYRINIQCYSRTIGLLDEMESAKTIEVIEGDFFGTGRLPVLRKGVLIEQIWTHE
jgi:lipopolysaccharide transport system ATP-binding protein